MALTRRAHPCYQPMPAEPRRVRKPGVEPERRTAELEPCGDELSRPTARCLRTRRQRLFHNQSIMRLSENRIRSIHGLQAGDQSAPGSPDPAPPALCRAGGGPGMHCNRPTALPCPLTIQHLDGARASCQLCWRRRKVPDDHDVSGRVSSCRFRTLRVRVILDHCLNAAFVRSRTVELSQQYRSCCDSASAA